LVRYSDLFEFLLFELNKLSAQSVGHQIQTGKSPGKKKIKEKTKGRPAGKSYQPMKRDTPKVAV